MEMDRLSRHGVGGEYHLSHPIPPCSRSSKSSRSCRLYMLKYSQSELINYSGGLPLPLSLPLPLPRPGAAKVSLGWNWNWRWIWDKINRARWNRSGPTTRLVGVVVGVVVVVIMVVEHAALLCSAVLLGYDSRRACRMFVVQSDLLGRVESFNLLSQSIRRK